MNNLSHETWRKGLFCFEAHGLQGAMPYVPPPHFDLNDTICGKCIVPNIICSKSDSRDGLHSVRPLLLSRRPPDIGMARTLKWGLSVPGVRTGNCTLA